MTVQKGVERCPGSLFDLLGTSVQARVVVGSNIVVSTPETTTTKSTVTVELLPLALRATVLNYKISLE